MDADRAPPEVTLPAMRELFAQLERTPVEVRSLGHAWQSYDQREVGLVQTERSPRHARMTMQITAGFCLGYTIAATRHSANTVMVNTLSHQVLRSPQGHAERWSDCFPVADPPKRWIQGDSTSERIALAP